MKERILFALSLAFFCPALPPLCALEPGDKAPPFVLPDLQKRHVWSKDYLGKQWVLVDFFATDCEGCKKELPILEKFFLDFQDRGVAVLVMATDCQGEEVVVPFFQRKPTPLTVLLDRYQVTVKKYGVTEIPSLFLVNPQGLIVHKEVGFREDLYEQLSGALTGEAGSGG